MCEICLFSAKRACSAFKHLPSLELEAAEMIEVPCMSTQPAGLPHVEGQNCH